MVSIKNYFGTEDGKTLLNRTLVAAKAAGGVAAIMGFVKALAKRDVVGMALNGGSALLAMKAAVDVIQSDIHTRQIA